MKKDLKEEKNFLGFSDWLSNNYRKSEWIIVGQTEKKIDEKRNNLFTFSVLVEKNNMVRNKLLKSPDWEINNSTLFGYPNFDRDDNDNPLFVPNFSMKIDGMNFYPFIYYISYQNHPEKTDNLEILQHFHLYHRAYFLPEKREYAFYDRKSSTTETVTRIEEDEKTYKVVVNRYFLRDYLAARKCFLIRYHHHYRSSDHKIEFNKKNRSELVINDEIRNYQLIITSERRGRLLQKATFSSLVGKDIIEPYSEPPKQRELLGEVIEEKEKFIIDIDDTGNYLEADSRSYYPLTPVYFNKEVLKKYVDNPSDYEVGSRFIRTRGGYYITYNPVDEFIVVWLKDLGGLPIIEQKHWKSYNVRSEKKISEEMYKRDFLAEFIEPQNDLIYKFKEIFENLQSLTKEKLGKSLFKELRREDSHNYSSLHIPYTNEWKEFDEVINALTKVTTDSINVKLLKQLTGKKIDKKKFFGSIDLLECLLNEKGVKKQKQKAIIEQMRLLQTIRSQSATHRKGRDIKETLKKFDLECLSTANMFEDLIKKLTNAFILLTSEIRNW